MKTVLKVILPAQFYVAAHFLFYTCVYFKLLGRNPVEKIHADSLQ